MAAAGSIACIGRTFILAAAGRFGATGRTGGSGSSCQTTDLLSTTQATLAADVLELTRELAANPAGSKGETEGVQVGGPVPTPTRPDFRIF